MKKFLVILVGMYIGIGLPAQGADVRSYTAGRFAVSVDGGPARFVKSISGGAIKGEVATHDLGTGMYQKKHLATISYEPFTIELGLAATNGLSNWIQSSMDKAMVSKNGQIYATDYEGKVVASREFIDSYISEVTFPTLDGSSTDPAYLTVTVHPSSIRYQKGDGSQLKGGSTTTKNWLASNFRFELGDLPGERVSKIDSFSWEQSITEDPVGAFREPKKNPGKIEVSNLTLTISMADFDPWAQWHKSFVIDGKATDDDEVSGSITFLGPDLQEELAQVQLMNVGIVSLEQNAMEPNKEELARFTVELYVERMLFEPSQGK